MDIEEARNLHKQLDMNIWKLVDDFHKQTGLMVEGVTITWRQYGNLSIRPGTWQSMGAKSDVRWR